MSLKIKDRDGDGTITVAEMRTYFERSIKGTPLGTMDINGEFDHYMDADTDTLWIGFALGMRCAERISKPKIAELLATIDRYEDQWVDEHV